MIPGSTHLHVGSLLFEGMDQIDLTGPFEVLAPLPDATFPLLDKSRRPVRDTHGLLLSPDRALAEAPALDLPYAPEPPFDGGRPERAPAAVLAAAPGVGRELAKRRLATARRVGQRWDVVVLASWTRFTAP